jgi:hypothetical protein
LSAAKLFPHSPLVLLGDMGPQRDLQLELQALTSQLW